VNPNYAEINVEESLRDPDSIFHYYRKLIDLRKRHPIMIYGDYRIVLEEHEQIYAYTRSWRGETWLVLLNFSDRDATAKLPAELLAGGEPERIVGNYAGIGEEAARPLDDLKLQPYEARVYRLAK